MSNNLIDNPARFTRRMKATSPALEEVDEKHVASSHGNVNCLEWCQKEAAIINRQRERCRVVESGPWCWLEHVVQGQNHEVQMVSR